MSIEIRGTRVESNGSVTCDVEVPGDEGFTVAFANIEHYVRGARVLLGISTGGFRPVPLKAAFSHAEQVSHNARQLTPEQTEALRYQMRHEAAQRVTAQDIPYTGITAHVPRAGGFLMADIEEPPLRANDFTGAEGTD